MAKLAESFLNDIFCWTLALAIITSVLWW